MSKGVTSLNIKNENGSFTNVPIAVKAENVKLNNGKNLEDSVAYLDTETIDSGIEAPIKTPLYQEDVVDHLYSSSSITPLSAAQGKVLQNEIDTLKTAGTVPSDTLSSEIIDIRNGGNGKVYPSAGTAVRSQLSAKEDRSNKVSSKNPVTGELLSAGKNAKYPSIDFLQQFYYDISQIDELIEQAKNQIGTADWAELKDLRVGADGKQYDNAGLSVRTNIQKALDKIDKLLNSKADKATTLKGYCITDAYTKSESKSRFGLGVSVTFDENFIPLSSSSSENLSTGMLTDIEKNIKYMFISSKVTYVSSGFFSFHSCDNIEAIFVDNTKENILIDTSDNRIIEKIHYVDDFNANNFIIKALLGKLDKSAGSVTTDNIASKAVTTDKLADEVKTSINSKYDSKNIEEGSTTLTPYSSSIPAINSAECLYTKIGKQIICNIKITLNEYNMIANSSIHFIDLPFVTNLPYKLYFNAVTNNKGYLRAGVNQNSSWLTFINNTNNSIAFVSGDTIDVTILYKTK